MQRLMRVESLDYMPIVSSLDAWLVQHPHLQTVAGFSALPDEVNLIPLVARHPNRRWVFPRVIGDDLVFHIVKTPQSELVRGSFGVLEPISSLPQVAITDIDVFFCPGVAFDPHGGRLGRGKGYYDRMLAEAKIDAEKIGVCFSCQMVSNTHLQPHDVLMDEVIFE